MCYNYALSEFTIYLHILHLPTNTNTPNVGKKIVKLSTNLLRIQILLLTDTWSRDIINISLALGSRHNLKYNATSGARSEVMNKNTAIHVKRDAGKNSDIVINNHLVV